MIYECIELSALILRCNSGEKQQQQQPTKTTNQHPLPPFFFHDKNIWPDYCCFFFLKEVTKTLTVFHVSLYGHISQQLSQYHPREDISVLSLCLQTKCVVFHHTYIILFLYVLVTNWLLIYQVCVMDVAYLRYSWTSKGCVYSFTSLGSPLPKFIKSLSDLPVDVGISPDY